MRRKQVDSDRVRAEGQQQLAKELNVPELVAIGVGSTVGAGVYVLVGTVAREHAGPALTISFLIAGIAAALSAFCYAELASRCPSAGSAYHYSYICVGEGVAWLIGWALVLEYTIGGSAVARGISPNLVSVISLASSFFRWHSINALNHMPILINFLYLSRPCFLEDRIVCHGFWHAISFHGSISLLIPVLPLLFLL